MFVHYCFFGQGRVDLIYEDKISQLEIDRDDRSSRPASLVKDSSTSIASLLLTPCRTRLLRGCYFVLFQLLSPAPLRTVLALFTHTAPHIVFTGYPNILTIIRGFGNGKRFSNLLNSSQLRQLLFPLRFNHLNNSFFTA